ncbi:MAG: hypothetical protein AAGA23_12200 [Pseudomonadota bacterium]
MMTKRLAAYFFGLCVGGAAAAGGAGDPAFDLDVVDSYRWDEVTPADPNLASQFGRAIATDGEWAMIGAPEAENRIGQILLFQASTAGRPWRLLGPLASPTDVSFCRAGTRLALSGDWLIASTNCGPFLYARNQGGSNSWGLVGLLPEPLDVVDLSRASASTDVSVSGDLMAIGRRETDFTGDPFINAMGEVAIHQRDAGGAGAWGEIAVILPPVPDRAGGGFGTRVSLQGQRVLVAASGFSDGTFTGVGRAWLFEQDLGGSNNWGLRQTFSNPRPVTSGFFGDDVELGADVVAIGGPAGELTPAVSNDRAVYVYQQNTGGANAWGLVDEVLPVPAGAGFGGNIQIAGDLMLVGDGPGSTLSRGAWLYERDGQQWPLRQSFLADDTNEPEPELFRNLGHSVGLGIRGTRTVAVIADDTFERTNAGSRIGKAFFFEYDDGLFMDSFEAL